MATARHQKTDCLNCILVEAVRVGFIVFLTVLVSGLVPMLIQAYGWYDMARKAGGMDKIVEVVTEAPACEFCKAAQRMQQKSEPSQENSPNKDRVETVKVYAVFHGSDQFKAGRFASPGREIWRLVGDEVLPDSLAVAPSVPPPEFFV